MALRSSLSCGFVRRTWYSSSNSSARWASTIPVQHLISERKVKSNYRISSHIQFLRFNMYKVHDHIYIANITRASPIHRQHSPSGSIIRQSAPSTNDDNRWPVHANVSRWGYSPNSGPWVLDSRELSHACSHPIANSFNLVASLQPVLKDFKIFHEFNYFVSLSANIIFWAYLRLFEGRRHEHRTT